MKKLKESTKTFNGATDADTTFSRLSNKKSMKGKKTPQEKLGIEDQGIEPLGGRNRLSMMDIITSMYEDPKDKTVKEAEFNKGWQKSSFTKEEKQDFMHILEYLANKMPEQKFLTPQDIANLENLNYVSFHTKPDEDVFTPSHLRLIGIDPQKIIDMFSAVSRDSRIPPSLQQSAKGLHAKLSAHFK